MMVEFCELTACNKQFVVFFMFGVWVFGFSISVLLCLVCGWCVCCMNSFLVALKGFVNIYFVNVTKCCKRDFHDSPWICPVMVFSLLESVKLVSHVQG